MTKTPLLTTIILLFLTQTVVFYFGYNNTPFWNDMYFIMERVMLTLVFFYIHIILPERYAKHQVLILGLNLKEIFLFCTIIAFGRLTWVILRILGYTTVVNEKLSYFYILTGIGIFTCFLVRKYFLSSKIRKK